MDQLVDASSFPMGENLDYESEEEVAQLEALPAAIFTPIVGTRQSPTWSWRSASPPIIALFLARREPGARPEDAERWVVVGNLPSNAFRDG